ncbi:penicillin-binding transpeptidase domain-containing protein [Streptomyces sp. SCSIO 30461]|uniref:penicillin-binding transpeptidase domain-containing protein n=1 Tax=Streptomyces sp. SCSIO 30461 TaxID=3118085 RepID=UPI0030D5A6FD
MARGCVYRNYPPPRYGRSHRRRTAVAAVAASAALAGAGFWAYTTLVVHPEDSRVQAATERLQGFLDAWEAGAARRAGAYTATPAYAESLITSVMTNLKPSKAELRALKGTRQGSREVRIPFAVAMTIPGAGDYTWESKARLLLKRGGHSGRDGQGTWEVEFTTPLIHPELAPGQTLALRARRRAAVLDTHGDTLRAPSLVGLVDPKSGKGISGLEARYDRQLTGGAPGMSSVVIVDRASGRAVKGIRDDSGAKGGVPVRTTIDARIQEAAAGALDGLEKNAAIVALDPATGRILAAANRPGGMNRALEGRYPPGSTFKVITAAALLKAGMRPADRADCPVFAHVNGQRFENHGRFGLPGGATLTDAFARSCNTFFINARTKLKDASLHDTARAFGIGGAWDVGVATYDGSVPAADGDNDKAAATVGQARVQVSPLVMASVAATVKDGTFRQPFLVPAAVKNKHHASERLVPAVLSALRGMMRATVAEGTAQVLQDVPGEAHAKTGTAEYGDQRPPRTHAWMIGYQGQRNLAWAVFVEDGGSGGADAGPVAARFLKAVG